MERFPNGEDPYPTCAIRILKTLIALHKPFIYFQAINIIRATPVGYISCDSVKRNNHYNNKSVTVNK
jgi:hypothetical protein